MFTFKFVEYLCDENNDFDVWMNRFRDIDGRVLKIQISSIPDELWVEFLT